MTKRFHLSAWFAEFWPRVTIATGVGYLAIAYTISRWLTRRSPARLAPPSHLAHGRVESLCCKTRDGIDLKGWLIEPDHPHATVALFHGLRANRSQALSRIEFLTAAGYRCVAFDHRAHGESAGRWTSFGFLERQDVEAVTELIRTRWPHQPCAALGISMGGAALCFAGEQSRAFDALIIESVYHDLLAAFQHRVGCVYPAWFNHFRNGIIWLLERRFGVQLQQVAPLAHIAKLAPRPVLVLTGSDDPHAPPHEVQLLAEQLPTTALFRVIAGAGHEDVLERGGSDYQQSILTFLANHLPRAFCPIQGNHAPA